MINFHDSQNLILNLILLQEFFSLLFFIKIFLNINVSFHLCVFPQDTWNDISLFQHHSIFAKPVTFFIKTKKYGVYYHLQIYSKRGLKPKKKHYLIKCYKLMVLLLSLAVFLKYSLSLIKSLIHSYPLVFLFVK